MIQDYIDLDFPTVSPEDSGELAIDLMEDSKTNYLPVVEGDELLGLISEDEALHHPLEEAISEDALLKNVYIRTSDHLLEAVEMMNKHSVDVVPVIDGETYVGVVKYSKLVPFINKTFSASVKGSYILLEMPINGYSLTEIATIFEAENHKIIFSSVEFDEYDKNLIRLHIKTNSDSLDSIISHLERHKLKIVEVINQGEYGSVLRERYDSLMSYLNV